MVYKLLIADDNQTHIDCVINYIDWEKLNFTEIKTASNGKEAFDIFTEFKPDLVITDVVMPLCSGHQLAEKIRETDRDVHIVFMSCYEDFVYVKKAIDNNITAYILKPIEPDNLKETVLKIIGNIEQRSRSLHAEKAAEEFLPFARESVLYRYLYQENPNVSENLINYTRLKNLGRTILVKYTILNAKNSDTDPYTLLDSIYESFDDFEVNAITEIPNKVIVLLSTSGEDEEMFVSRAVASVREHIEYTLKAYGLELASGMSNPFDGISDARTMLIQANKALESSYSLKAGEIYFFEEFSEQDDRENSLFDVFMLRHDLTELISNSNPQALNEFMDKYYPQNTNPNKNSIKALCFATVTTLQLLMAERNADINNLFESPDVIWTKLNNFDTIKDTYHWLKNILVACCEYVNEIEKKTKHKLINSITDYIDKNYRDISSVSQIASELFISTGYAKNVFKKHTGQTIFDYLVDKRISEAKKLLKDPSVKVYEVSQMVGYTSKSHFAETFKRKTGMTPKEYLQKQN